ncbi:MAG: hypothetical protein KBT33_08050 [Prevotellaceae bacterium]|nr:hypothetical protein [Candidatus Minthosoma equi]
MKRVLFLVVSAFLAVTSSFASVTENVVSSISERKATEMIKKQVNNGTELVLDMASNIASQLNGHYSHSSHRSHSSHSSHRSHYSSR